MSGPLSRSNFFHFNAVLIKNKFFKNFMQVLTNYGQITGYSSLKSWIRHYGAPPTPLAMNVRNSRPTILQCQKTDCLVLPILIHKKAKILNKRIEYILFRICYVYYFCYSWKSLSIAITSVGIHLRYCKDVISLEMRNWKLLLFCTFLEGANLLDRYECPDLSGVSYSLLLRFYRNISDSHECFTE